MSHPAHIILDGGVGDEDEHGEYALGSVHIVWNTPAGMSHEEVAKRVKKLLNLEERMYWVMDGTDPPE